MGVRVWGSRSISVVVETRLLVCGVGLTGCAAPSIRHREFGDGVEDPSVTPMDT